MNRMVCTLTEEKSCEICIPPQFLEKIISEYFEDVPGDFNICVVTESGESYSSGEITDILVRWSTEESTEIYVE